MNSVIRQNKEFRRALLVLVVLFISNQSFGQKTTDWELEKIPVSLETDFALSALPPQLRHDATVYLLNPKKGYYVAHKGSNGFMCFVTRTEWEWGEFRKDDAAAIGFDAEGARTIFPVCSDVAAMRATGKFTALQIKNIVIDRIRKGIYKAPARTGISYMLAPVMRTYPGKPDHHDVMTMNMPHYMFYAPYLTNKDIGNIPNGEADGPVVINPGAMWLGERKSPYGYIILPAGVTEKAKIINENKGLLKRLTDYKSYFKVDPGSMQQ
ncbi:hypothetical protein JN11_01145 [Mucilaginibacter frigoritolerans]|uniref:Uncharacterized protein n=1 Tax=Mucilaginibacter frigoritolerans TaxID=652788 RepID=A0A562UCQ6_9SPHI|nr:hypothetical protein [Mucilaginibacter frigoritolerans]TWJ03598.1 hypothetical protein JN11_01145 [Mucilaginibacter frigoritolerans]